MRRNGEADSHLHLVPQDKKPIIEEPQVSNLDIPRTKENRWSLIWDAAEPHTALISELQQRAAAMSRRSLRDQVAIRVLAEKTRYLRHQFDLNIQDAAAEFGLSVEELTLYELGLPPAHGMDPATEALIRTRLKFTHQD